VKYISENEGIPIKLGFPSHKRKVSRLLIR